MKKLAVLLLFFYSSCFSMTGQTIFDMCEHIRKFNYSKTHIDQNLICSFYIAGVIDELSIILLQGMPEQYNRWDMIKYKVSYYQESLIVYKYLENHPEKLHMNASSLIVAAIFEAFPFPPQKTKS